MDSNTASALTTGMFFIFLSVLIISGAIVESARVQNTCIEESVNGS